MAFLIHAYRKLFLKRKINDLEFRSIQLSQQRQQISEQVGVMQQAMSMAKNAASLFSSSALNSFQNEIFSKYKDSNGNINIPDADKANIQAQMMQKQQAIAMSTYAANSIFESASNAQLKPLNMVDTQLSLEMASMETQLKTLRPELESVEKAETEAAKSEAPKFGLG